MPLSDEQRDSIRAGLDDYANGVGVSAWDFANHCEELLAAYDEQRAEANQLRQWIDRRKLLTAYDEQRAEVERLRAQVAAVEALVSRQENAAKSAAGRMDLAGVQSYNAHSTMARQNRAALTSADEVQDAE